MNLRFLKTLLAVAQHSTLNAAAQSVGLSHSAVSLQIKSLEDELQIQILDRSKRPPVLTHDGQALVTHAKRMECIADDIRALAGGGQLHGKVTVGAVPSTITHLMAPALARMYDVHPDLQIELHTGLSDALIRDVLDGDLDAALVSEPGLEAKDLSVTQICNEPFRLITSLQEQETDPLTLLAKRPFIWFDKRSWLSQQVQMHLLNQKIHVQKVMEVDTFEAVEALVAHNLGVSILPRRALARFQAQIREMPLSKGPLSRRVVLVCRKSSPRHLVSTELADALAFALNG